MKNLVLHPGTKRALDMFMLRPTHAVLLNGPAGVGKGSLADALACQLLAITTTVQHTAVIVIHPDEKHTISIDAVRRVQQFLRLKTTGERELRRAIIIEQADALTTEAQNALLKSLEEPPADTLIVLTCTHRRALLPTIQSRVQEISVGVPPPVALKKHFATHHKPETIERIYLLSGGLPGLMTTILNGEDHPLQTSVEAAKELLRMTQFERLARVDQLNKKREDVTQTLLALERIAEVSIHQAATAKNDTALRRWHAIRKQTVYAQQALSKNANPKLVFTNFLLRI